ncbi:hypothetical protein HJC23_007879 [Cyclotella cryptica]|uniref:Chloride channel protein n=1 Tax=Cyclotella cryptica TaxID=29204 RepID=A0ABD3R0D9_9STRA|eukprot:CCRYP_000210-RA/>CCRYP_000210-RA protein AED:0.38 eAED:0.38 QI:0/-1/0/1/-1/1/1/0/556
MALCIDPESQLTRSNVDTLRYGAVSPIPINHHHDEITNASHHSPTTVLTPLQNHLGISEVFSSDQKPRRERDDSFISDESLLFARAALAGGLAASMGYIYSIILQASVNTIWKIIPNAIHATPAYIAVTISFGGLLVGILHALLDKSYTLPEFILDLSGKPSPQNVPTLFPALVHTLLLSIVTSSFAFSVGPEAPMISAGCMIGAALARHWYKDADGQGDDELMIKHLVLIYAGASGALTAFLEKPLAGSIFALELTNASSNLATVELGPIIVASTLVPLLIKALIWPNASMKAFFTYGEVGDLNSREALAIGLGCGLVGAVLGTIFHQFVALLKGPLWSTRQEFGAQSTGEESNKYNVIGFLTKRVVLVRALVGLAVGLLSMYYPTTMFWSEGTLQCAVDGHLTPFNAVQMGLSKTLTTAARVDTSIPFEDAWDAAQVGIFKFIAIVLACAGKFPGGVIYPLFFAGASLAHAFVKLLPSISSESVSPVVVMALMASSQSSVTRTPLATVVLLTVSATSLGTQISIMLPSVIVSSYVGVWFSRFLATGSYFRYSYE